MTNTHVLELEKHSGPVAVTQLVGSCLANTKTWVQFPAPPKPYVHMYIIPGFRR